jgi:hypothetical protein
MSKPLRPKLRMAPPMSAMASQQVSVLEKLQRLQDWTEEPIGERQEGEAKPAPYQPPPEPTKAAPEPVMEAPAPSRRPWEAVPEEKLHPFTVHMTERLFVKMGYCWKRTDQKSAKAFLVQALEEACDKALRELGEAP